MRHSFGSYFLGKAKDENLTASEIAALNELGSRADEDVFAGLIVLADTKQRICRAFAICLTQLSLDLDLIPLKALEEWIRDYWDAYERTSGLLAQSHNIGINSEIRC